MKRLINWCLDHHVATAVIMAAITVLLATVATLPSIWPDRFPNMHGVVVDTDPENMLPEDEPVRVFTDQMEREFTLYDMLVVGVVNEAAPNYVFNAATLRDVYELTEYAKSLTGAAVGKPDDPKAGVIGIDIIAPSTVDNVEQGGLGSVSFEWLMAEPPASDEGALAIRDKALNLPFMKGTLVSEDGQALALYLPLSDKHLSFKTYNGGADGSDLYSVGTLVTYCCYTNAVPPAGSNQNVPPNFINRSIGNYHLSSVDTSCIDKGNDSVFVVGDLDLDGNPRRSFDHVDIGCFERQPGAGTCMTIR